MNQINGESNPEASPNFPAKRRRGRPRKDPSQGVTRRVTSPVVPPGHDRVNGTHSLQLDAIEDSYNGVVGQPVTGVIESSFEAGYLLSVRIGSSGTNFRGVVFKPGHYVPISAENDVAPHVQMVRRNEISLPLQVRSRGRHRRSRGRNARHVPEPEMSLGSRGNMVPVLLQPVNQAPQGGLYNDPTNIHAQTGVDHLPPSMSHGENGNFSMNQGGPSALHVTERGGADLSGEDSDDVDEPLDAMPLQAVHTYARSKQSQPVHKPLEVQRVGKMTELLQAVQENAPVNPLLGAENLMTRNEDAQA